MIAIVGGGLAAAKLVEGYREAGGEEPITIWSADPHGPYHRPPLSKRLLRGEAEAPDALVHPVDWYAEQNVDLRLGATVASLSDVVAETIVLATGARPRPLDGALVLRTIDNSLELRRRAEAADTAVVIGGGFIGCEVSASLTLLGVQVTQVVRDPMLFAPLQAPPLSEALHNTYREHGVDLRLGATEAPGARSVTSPSSSTPSSGVRAGSSTGRTRPTTAPRSGGSSPARPSATTPFRRSSRRSSGARSSTSATRSGTTAAHSRGTSTATARCSGSCAAGRRSPRH